MKNTLFVLNNKKTWSHCGQYSFLVKSAKTLLISLLHSFTLAEEMAPKRGRATQREGQKVFCSPDFNSSFIYSWFCCCQQDQEKILRFVFQLILLSYNFSFRDKKQFWGKLDCENTTQMSLSLMESSLNSAHWAIFQSSLSFQRWINNSVKHKHNKFWKLFNKGAFFLTPDHGLRFVLA